MTRSFIDLIDKPAQLIDLASKNKYLFYSSIIAYFNLYEAYSN